VSVVDKYPAPWREDGQYAARQVVDANGVPVIYIERDH